MGLILRGAFVWEINWLDYRNMMHGHSHVAMLGWVYMALYLLIGYRFIPREKWQKPIYSKLFWFTQITVLGMMISFPLQGYGAVSIAFSSLHILASYAFCYLVCRDHKIKHPEVALLLKAGLVLLVISTIGVWSLGPLTLSGGRSSTLYQLAIQFYLHFQFHGWFTFSLLALLLDVLTRNSLFNSTTFKRFYAMLLISVILTYGLVLEWGLGGPFPLILNGLGLVSQLMALLLFFKMMRENKPDFFLNKSPISKAFLNFGLLSWIFKVIIQTAVLLPAVAVVSFTIRSFMIGFIHLTMLGFVSGLLFALIFEMSTMKRNEIVHAGKITFIVGFVVTEFLLFVQGLFYWLEWGQFPAFYELIFSASALLPISILLIIMCLIKYSTYKLDPKMITA